MDKTTTFPHAYIRKKFCKIEDAVVSIQCKAIQYGLGCFSGIRANWNPKKKNLYLFRMEDHFKRLKEGAKIIGLKFDMEYPEFKKIVLELVRKNNIKENAYIRPTLYAGAKTLTPRFDNPEDDLALYAIPLTEYYHAYKGLNVCISSWRRFDDDVISVKAKVTGGYANAALAKTEALLNGFDEAIFLNRDGKICEASSSNIFGVKDGKVFTTTLGGNNLNGVTRRTILELFEKELKIKVNEEEIDRSTLYVFDEVFFTGTAAKLSWIESIDRRVIGDGKMGPYAKKLKALFEKVLIGEMPKYKKWLTEVY